jgi:hypothetical protein
MIALGLAWAPATARTQSAGDAALVERITGRWQLAIPESEGRSRIARGIAAATDPMPPLVSSIAARMLRDHTPLSRTVEVAASAERVVVRFDRTSYETRPGHPRDVPVPEDPSETMEVVQHFRDGHLEQVFTTDGGRRWNTFTPSADGATLTMDAVISASQLPADVRFTLPYRRAD